MHLTSKLSSKAAHSNETNANWCQPKAEQPPKEPVVQIFCRRWRNFGPVVVLGCPNETNPKLGRDLRLIPSAIRIAFLIMMESTTDFPASHVTYLLRPLSITRKNGTHQQHHLKSSSEGIAHTWSTQDVWKVSLRLYQQQEEDAFCSRAAGF